MWARRRGTASRRHRADSTDAPGTDPRQSRWSAIPSAPRFRARAPGGSAVRVVARCVPHRASAMNRIPRRSAGIRRLAWLDPTSSERQTRDIARSTTSRPCPRAGDSRQRRTSTSKSSTRLGRVLPDRACGRSGVRLKWDLVDSESIVSLTDDRAWDSRVRAARPFPHSSPGAGSPEASRRDRSSPRARRPGPHPSCE